MVFTDFLLKKSLNSLVVCIFSVNVICPSNVAGQSIAASLSAPIIFSNFVQLHGLKVYPDQPFRMDFIIDAGSYAESPDVLKVQSEKLIKYFLAALTIPEKDLWVNLSPYEPNRIIPEVLARTSMGQGLLEQDLELKELVFEILHPEHLIGRKFWHAVYENKDESRALSGEAVVGGHQKIINDITESFNKVWIVPSKILVYENHLKALVVDAQLKVLTQEDYAVQSGRHSEKTENIDQEGILDIFRQIVIPEIEREVNQGERFSHLRQIYHSFVLAAWYKRRLKDSLLRRFYVNRSKIEGIDDSDVQQAETVYQQYLEVFSKASEGLIQEEYDPQAQEIIARQYMLGGFEVLQHTDQAMVISSEAGVLNQVHLARPFEISSQFFYPVVEKQDKILAAGAPTEAGEADFAQMNAEISNSLLLGKSLSRTDIFQGDSKLLYKINYGFLPDDHEIVVWAYQRLRRLFPSIPENELPKINILASKGMGINAMAFPDGDLLFSPEIMETFEYQEEFDHVLLHEVNHWARKHSFQLTQAQWEGFGMLRYFEHESDITALYMAGEPERGSNPEGGVIFQKRMREISKKMGFSKSWDIAHGRADFSDRILASETLIRFVHLTNLDSELTAMPPVITESVKRFSQGHDLDQLMELDPLDRYQWASSLNVVLSRGNFDILTFLLGFAYQELNRYKGIELDEQDQYKRKAYQELFNKTLPIWMNAFKKESQDYSEEDTVQTARIFLDSIIGIPVFMNSKVEPLIKEHLEINAWRSSFRKNKNHEKSYESFVKSIERLKEKNPLWMSTGFMFDAAVDQKIYEMKYLSAYDDEKTGLPVLKDFLVDVMKITDFIKDMYPSEMRPFLKHYSERSFQKSVFEAIVFWNEMEGGNRKFKKEFIAFIKSNPEMLQMIAQGSFFPFFNRWKKDQKPDADLINLVHEDLFVGARLDIFQDSAKEEFKSLVDQTTSDFARTQKRNSVRLIKNLNRMADILIVNPDLRDLVYKFLLGIFERINSKEDVEIIFNWVKIFSNSKSDFIQNIKYHTYEPSLQDYVFKDPNIPLGPDLEEHISKYQPDNWTLEESYRVNRFEGIQKVRKIFGREPHFIKELEINYSNFSDLRKEALKLLHKETTQAGMAREEFFVSLQKFLGYWSVYSQGILNKYNDTKNVYNQEEQEMEERNAADITDEQLKDIINKGLSYFENQDFEGNTKDIMELWNLSFFIDNISVQRLTQDFLLKKVIVEMDFEYAYKFLFVDYRRHNIVNSLDTISLLIEKARTPDQLDRMKKKFDDLIHSTDFYEQISKSVGVEEILSSLLKKNRKEEILKLLLNTQKDDKELKLALADVWWASFSGPVLSSLNQAWGEIYDFNDLENLLNMTLEEIDRFTGKDPLIDIRLSGIPSPQHILDMVFNMDFSQKTFLLKELLLGVDGIFADHKKSIEIVQEILSERLSGSQEDIRPIIDEVIEAFSKTSTPEEKFLLLHGFLSDNLAVYPLEVSSWNAAIGESVYDIWRKMRGRVEFFVNDYIETRLDETDGDYFDLTQDFKISSKIQEIFSHISGQNLQDKFDEIYSESYKAAHVFFVETIMDWQRKIVQRIVNEHTHSFNDPRNQNNPALIFLKQAIEKERDKDLGMDEMDFVFKAAPAYGPPGWRMLQLIRYLTSMTKDIKHKFDMNVFDAAEGQSKIQFYENLKLEDPVYAGRILEIGEKLGTGSFNTVYKVKIIADETDYPELAGQEVWEAVHVMNPNGAWRAKKEIQNIRKTLEELVKKDDKYKSVIFVVSLLEEWIDGELNDVTFVDDDREFYEKYNGKTLGEQWKKWSIKVPRVFNYDRKNIRVLREELLEGENLTQISSLPKDSAKDVVAFGVQHYFSQLMGGLSLEDQISGGVVKVHSDVSPGNYKFSQDDGKFVFSILDRRMYLKFTMMDRMMLGQIASTELLEEKVEMLLKWLKLEERNQSSFIQEDEGFRRLLDKISGEVADKMDLMESIADILRLINADGVYIPLRIILLFRNLNVWNQMSMEVGFEGGIQEALQWNVDKAMVHVSQADEDSDVFSKDAGLKGGIDFGIGDLPIFIDGHQLEVPIPGQFINADLDNIGGIVPFIFHVQPLAFVEDFFR